MDFMGEIDMSKARIEYAGYTTQLWEPEFGWSTQEEREAMSPHPPQILAAYHLFIAFYIDAHPSVHAHLAAEMQAGKTGSIVTFIRMVLSNFRLLRTRPDNVYVICGMNDDAWKKQTAERMIEPCRKNVEHSKGLSHVHKELKKHAEYDRRNGSPYLRNTIVIMDESQIATSYKNQPSVHVWNTLHEVCPVDLWLSNNIRVITISATDPAKVISIADDTRSTCVRLYTTPSYRSISDMIATGRLRAVDPFGNLPSPRAVSEIHRCIMEEFRGEPLYHILRPQANKYEETASALKDAFPRGAVDVIPWDAKSKATRGSDTSMSDINELLSEAPVKPTFIIVKQMFYASKTLDDTYVGILYDRASAQDSTNLQSFMGRACGYNKNLETIVYACKQTIDNYVGCWKDACMSPDDSRKVFDVVPSDLRGRMPNVIASGHTSGTGTVLIPDTSTMRRPIDMARAAAVEGVAAQTSSSNRHSQNQDEFDWALKEFPTLEAALSYAKSIGKDLHTPDKVDGFYHTTYTAKKKLVWADYMTIQNGKKTGGMPANKCTEIGNTQARLYVFYRDEHNPDSAVYVVRTLTRLR
jgi:hypothetical protein